jgi:hypothetical protein
MAGSLIIRALYKSLTKGGVTAQQCHASWWAGALRGDRMAEDNDVGRDEYRALAALAAEAFEGQRKKVSPPKRTPAAADEPDDDDDREDDEDEEEDEEEDEKAPPPRHAKKAKKPAAVKPPEKQKPMSGSEFSRRLSALEGATVPAAPEPGLITGADIRKLARRDGLSVEQAAMRLLDAAHTSTNTFAMGVPAAELAARYGRK